MDPSVLDSIIRVQTRNLYRQWAPKEDTMSQLAILDCQTQKSQSFFSILPTDLVSWLESGRIGSLCIFNDECQAIHQDCPNQQETVTGWNDGASRTDRHDRPEIQMV